MRVQRPGTRVLAALAVTALVMGLLIPLAIRVTASVTGLRFLVEFLTEGQRPWLSRGTAPPVREPLGGSSALPEAPDLYRPGDRPGPWPGLVLVHGLTPDGKRDARLAWTADRLARAGFVVAVPELSALRAERLRPGMRRSFATPSWA
jgi:hypothetical protein